ncbi:MAG TPA: hypothetical protein VH912_13680 [Streptosporangiaceae bacterium]|jgi:hypothetical protein
MKKHIFVWIIMLAIGATGFLLGRGTVKPISGKADPPDNLAAAADRAPAGKAPAAADRAPDQAGAVAGVTARFNATGAASKTKHLALNTSSADWPKLTSLGYNVFDIGPDAGELAALPSGGQGMLWVGNTTCDDFELSYGEFTAAVRRLAGNPRVFGWYLSDEPDPAQCPGVVNEIRRRADYIHAHASGQHAFVSATDYEYRPLRPANSHVDLIGLDPYPCESHCDMRVVDRYLNGAMAGGFPRNAIVPVFQTFGEECSQGRAVNRLPSESQLRQLLARWKTFAPHPVLDISYSWGHQDQWACPTLKDADGTNGRPDLQRIMKAHNLSSGAADPAPTQPKPKPKPPVCPPAKGD